MKIKKYEISRTLLVILSVGIFVVAFAFLAFLYMGEVQEKDDLQQELDSVNTELQIIDANIKLNEQAKKDLDAQIDETNTIISAIIKDDLTTSLLSSDIFQDMLDIAQATRVELTVIGESAIKNGTIDSISYELRTIDFTVSGRASNIYNFVNKLSHDLHTSILNSMSISTGSDPNEVTSAGMKLNIYSY